mgnify:CR=1 FL=1
MNRFLPLLALALATGSSSFAAATPTVAWTFHAGGKAHDKIRALTVDSHGNTFITGEFSDVVDFGRTRVTCTGELDFVLAKLNPEGKLLWVATAGGSKIDRGYAVAVDSKGSCYVTGHFQSDTIAFGKTVLRNRGDYDVFVAKYDSHGKPVWAKSAGGTAYDFGHGIGVDSQDAIYVSGSIRNAGDFDGSGKTAPENTGAFVAKYSNNGGLLWNRHMTGKGSSSGHELAVDSKGNIGVGGYFSGTASLGKHSLKTLKVKDIYAAELDSNGEFKWAFQAGGGSDGLVSGMAADHAGNWLIGGMFKGTARFGKQSFTSAGDNDFFIAKLSASGKPLWAAHAGGPGIDYGLGLAVDANGNALLTGETTGAILLAGTQFKAIGKRDLYAAKFSTDGKLLWVWQAGGKLNSLSYAAGCGPKGLNVIAGAFSGDIRIGAQTLVSRGSNDIIVCGLRD